MHFQFCSKLFHPILITKPLLQTMIRNIHKDTFNPATVNYQLSKVRSQDALLRNDSPKKKFVQIGQYKYDPQKDRIGYGYSSEVFKAIQTTPPYKTFALKKIDMRQFQDTNMEFMQSEVSLHKRLNHPNIIKFYEAIKTPNYYYIVLEYCSQGTLQDFIKKERVISAGKAIQIINQVIEGYKYLLSQEILHRDLKPSNILKEGKTWKISDFGFAIRTKFGFKGKINVGTPLYMAPEALNKNFYSYKSDIFSLGVIMYEILVKSTPWPSGTQKELIQQLKNELVIPQGIKNKKIREFIARSCEINQNKRMTREQFLNFQFEEQASQFGHLSALKYQKKSLMSQESTNLTSSGFEYEVEKIGLNKVKNQMMFAQLLMNCLKNINSFLFQFQTKQVFMLSFYKIVIRQLKSITDKKVNHFELKGWSQLLKNSKFIEIQARAENYIKETEKEYMDFIKHNEIKTIRMVNRKFPDLSHSAPLSQRFYQSLKLYTVFLIREHNHQLMKVKKDTQQQQKQFTLVYSDKARALQSLYQIYRYCESRTKPKESSSIELNLFKIVSSYSQCKYTVQDYLDLNRMIQNL